MKINSKDYHDYVIRDGKFIGKFEQMYQNVEDPWHHGNATDKQYNKMLSLLRKYRIYSNNGNILDIGCGKGAFTSRLSKTIPLAKILAIDISPTAIKKAKEKYQTKKIIFKVKDIQKDYTHLGNKFDLIIISQIMWYILPNFKKIVNYLIKKSLKKGGFLMINQCFYNKKKQTYGKKIVSSINDVLDLINLEPLEIINEQIKEDYNSIVIYKK